MSKLQWAKGLAKDPWDRDVGEGRPVTAPVSGLDGALDYVKSLLQATVVAPTGHPSHTQ